MSTKSARSAARRESTATFYEERNLKAFEVQEEIENSEIVQLKIVESQDSKHTKAIENQVYNADAVKDNQSIIEVTEGNTWAHMFALGKTCAQDYLATVTIRSVEDLIDLQLEKEAR